MSVTFHIAETSEHTVINHLGDLKVIDYDKLMAAAQQAGILTSTHQETFEDAPNNEKKTEIIFVALMNQSKPQLINFIRSVTTQGSYSHK